MSFVYEIISEEGLEYLRSFDIQVPRICGTGSWLEHYFHFGETGWVIDKERNILLFALCGQGYRFDKAFPPTYYVLIWENSPITFEVYRNCEGNNKIGIIETWELYSIIAPISLKDYSEEIIEAIKDAISSYCLRYDRNLLSINFTHIPTPFFVEGDVFNG